MIVIRIVVSAMSTLCQHANCRGKIIVEWTCARMIASEVLRSLNANTDSFLQQQCKEKAGIDMFAPRSDATYQM